MGIFRRWLRWPTDIYQIGLISLDMMIFWLIFLAIWDGWFLAIWWWMIWWSDQVEKPLIIWLDPMTWAIGSRKIMESEAQWYFSTMIFHHMTVLQGSPWTRRFEQQSHGRCCFSGHEGSSQCISRAFKDPISVDVAACACLCLCLYL